MLSMLCLSLEVHQYTRYLITGDFVFFIVIRGQLHASGSFGHRALLDLALDCIGGTFKQRYAHAQCVKLAIFCSGANE